MTNDDHVHVTALDSGILHIALNRPQQLNALNVELLQQLAQAFEKAKYDASIKAILLSGNGKAFCAGADIKQLAPLNGTTGLEFARFGQAVFNALEQLGKPSLAAIQGFALGGGCELAMAATLRIATTNGVFGQPEIKLGVIPGFGGTQRLSRLIGKGRALDVCLTAKKFTADQALQWGMLSELTTADELLPRAMAILNELVQLSPIAIQSMMTAIYQGYDMNLEEALALEAAQFAVCCSSTDKQEGVNAFLEKRRAVFIGA